MDLGFSPLHLDFTPHGQVAKITRIGFPGPVGRLECFLEFALIQQNFGQASIGGARWIGQSAAAWQRLLGFFQDVRERLLCENDPLDVD